MTTFAKDTPRPTARSILSNTVVRRIGWQVIAVVAVLGALSWFAGNASHNLAVRNIASGFGFLDREAGLPIAEHLISYAPEDTYLRALVVGTLNTLCVAFCGILLATILGVTIGVARLSRNWLVARAAAWYVEFFRNLPLLLQLFFWYSLLQALPPVRQALNPLHGIYLSNRGLSVPVLHWLPGHTWGLIAFATGVVATTVYARIAARKRLEDGRHRTVWPVAVALLIALPLMVSLALGATYSFDIPSPKGFNFRGGTTISPEFVALVVGLATYNAAFVAEIVRAGLLSVGQGQLEAARALALRPGATLRWIVFPQALRVIIPPLTSQYLNLTKSSALAVAIGYQDIVSIATTAMNQNGQAVELVGIIMGVYLTISLTISLVMNIYNARIALVER